MPHCDCPLKKSASDAPSLLCVIDKTTSFTFQEIDRLTDIYVQKFHQAGITCGDLVAFYPFLSHECIALIFAIWRLKANCLTLNPKLPQTQIESFVNRASATHFIHHPFHIESIQKRVPFFEQSLCLLTSGSTGTPKIAVLSLKTLLANASFSLSLKESDRYLLSLPLFHVGGMAIILRCILSKAAIVLNADHPLITHLSYIPTHLYRSVPIYKNLKCVLLGGSPIASYPHELPIYITYGLTEMGSMVLFAKNPPKIDSHYYLGEPLPKREIHLHVDGEIWVKGNCLFEGYLENNTILRPLTEDGWFQTKDIAAYHPQYGFTIIGRKDWQFISGGENIQPEEIEKHIKTIPQILDAVIVPKQHEEFGQVPAAVVRIENNNRLSLAYIQHHLQDLLPKYKIPKALFILNEFPKIGIKIDRKKITEIANQKN